MSRDDDARRCFGVTLRTLTTRVGRSIDAATPSDLEAAARWYDDAGLLAERLAGQADVSIEVAASVISAHSPKTPWSRNVAAATAHLISGPTAARRVGAMQNNVDRATRAKRGGFGALVSGPKTYAFAQNIAGDRDVVTIDVWMLRAFGVTEKELTRVGAYEVLAYATATASRARGLDPATGQAAAWIVARGGRTS